MDKDCVLIFKPKVARGLLKKGFSIIDIKAAKENSDRTIFVFKRSQELLDVIHTFK